MAMKTFVGVNNVEHFADQLSSWLEPQKRATLMRLLVEEEGRLGAGLEQLGVAEMRIAKGRQLITQQKALIARIQDDGRDLRDHHDHLDTLVSVQKLFERYRDTIINALDHYRAF